MTSHAHEESLNAAEERLRAMQTQEAFQYAVPDYLTAARQSLDATVSAKGATGAARIDERWRGRVCAWCFGLADRFEIEREVVAVTLNFLDRYLAGRGSDRRASHVTVVTAFYLAVKLFGSREPRASSAPMHLQVLSALVGGGGFRAADIAATETRILRALDWRVHPPTPLAFCRECMPLLSEQVPPRAHREACDLAQFLTEMSVGDYWFATRRPSAVGLAALLNALERKGPACSGPRLASALRRRVGVDVAHDVEVLECRARLRIHLRMAEEDAPRVATAGVLATDASAASNAPDTARVAVEAEARSAVAVRSVSPETVLPASPSQSCHKRTRSFEQSAQAKRTRRA